MINDIEIQNIGKEKMPSILNDPFNKNYVMRIYVSYSRNFSDKWQANGVVEFKNLNTVGEQRFTGDSFDEVVLKIKSFLNELTNKI